MGLDMAVDFGVPIEVEGNLDEFAHETGCLSPFRSISRNVRTRIFFCGLPLAVPSA